MRNNPWPVPHDTEHLFAKALLIYGPMPGEGWSVTRTAGREVIYVVPRTRETKAFVKEVSQLFAEEVTRRYAIKKWTPHHCTQVGRSWKNIFLKWVWEQIDA